MAPRGLLFFCPNLTLLGLRRCNLGQSISTEPPVTRSLILYPDLRHKSKGQGPITRQNRTAQQALDEAVSLSKAISNLEVVESEIIPIRAPKPGTLFGTGTMDSIKQSIEHLDISLVIVDDALTPIQQRNLERHWACKVIDRTGLILEIFGERARTREGTLQVELAALTYQRSRLVKSWTHLERQRGGFGFMGGPGESQLEIDRRLIDDRIASLKKKLEAVKRTRTLHRKKRREVPYPIVALVGYTNAGKSTLFNQLTRSEVMAEDVLFATLDPTMRKVKLPSGRHIILSDTVGFISNLPTQLVAAFRATLEEVQEADVLIHVRDLSHPQNDIQAQDVREVLLELGLEGKLDKDMIEVFNKIDLLDYDVRAALPTNAQSTPLSAITGEGIQDLLARIEDHLAKQTQELSLTLQSTEGKALAWLYAHGEVIDRDDQEDIIRVHVRLTPKNKDRYQALFEGKCV